MQRRDPRFHADGTPCSLEGYPHVEDDAEFLTRIPGEIADRCARLARARTLGRAHGTIRNYERGIRWLESERDRITQRLRALESHHCPVCGHTCEPEGTKQPITETGRALGWCWRQFRDSSL